MKTANRTARLPRPAWALLALGAALVLSAPSAADQGSEDKAFLVAKGRVTYRVYCINCHGAKAHGDGTLAELLSVKPSNLTVLKQENNGRFPTDRLTEVIDGRGEVRGHGMKEMPVWGDVFQTSSLEPSGEGLEGEARARQKIRELVLYLESIQE